MANELDILMPRDTDPGDGSWESMFEKALQTSQSSGPLPRYPGFKSLLGKDGLMPSQLRIAPNWNSIAGALLEKQATSMSPTAWAENQLAKADANARGAYQAAAQGAMGANAAAMSSLAMRGGLSSGARERAARNTARDLMMGNQQVGMNRETAGYDILAKDDETKRGLLNNLMVRDEDRTKTAMQADQFNIGNAIQEKRAGDIAALEEYKEKMKAWGADRTADAQENAGKK